MIMFEYNEYFNVVFIVRKDLLTYFMTSNHVLFDYKYNIYDTSYTNFQQHTITPICLGFWKDDE